MAWLVDLSERVQRSQMGEQGLLAEDVHAGRRGRQAVRQQQEACRAGSAGSVPSATSRHQAEKRSSSPAHASVLIAEPHSTAETRKCTLPTGWLQHR